MAGAYGSCGPTEQRRTVLGRSLGRCARSLSSSVVCCRVGPPPHGSTSRATVLLWHAPCLPPLRVPAAGPGVGWAYASRIVPRSLRLRLCRAHAAHHSPAALALRVRGFAFPPSSGPRAPRPRAWVLRTGRYRAAHPAVNPPRLAHGVCKSRSRETNNGKNKGFYEKALIGRAGKQHRNITAPLGRASGATTATHEDEAKRRAHRHRDPRGSRPSHPEL